MGISTRSLATGAALLMVFGLGSQVAAPPRSLAERGVRLALIRLNGLLSRRDMGILDEFVAAEDTLLIGSTAEERARGPAEIAAFYEHLFGRPETIAFAWRQVDVSAHGDVAWLHAEGHVIVQTDSGEQRLPYRLAGVLEPSGGRWKWRLFQGSQPTASA